MNIGFLLGGGILLLLHVLLTIEMRQNIFEGFFNSGSTVMSDEQPYPVVAREQTSSRQLNNFEQISDEHKQYSQVMVNSLLGSARLLTNSVGVKDLLKNVTVRDRDVAFNNAYNSSAGAKLTLYKMGVSRNARCFYIKELKKYGAWGRRVIAKRYRSKCSTPHER